jgi:hypothetical protein
MSEPADFAVTLPVLSGTITRMAPRWTDLFSFEVTPVVSDEQLGRAIG